MVSGVRLRLLILEGVDFKITPEALSADKALWKRQIVPKTKIMSTGLDDGTYMANIVWEVGFSKKTRTS